MLSPQRRRPTGSTPAAPAAARRARSGVDVVGRRCSHPAMRVITAPLVRQCRRKAYPALDPHEPSGAPRPPSSSMARLNRTSASAKRDSTACWSMPRCSAICSSDSSAKRWRRKTSRQSRGRLRIARMSVRRSRSSGASRRRLTASPPCPSRWRSPLRRGGRRWLCRHRPARRAGLAALSRNAGRRRRTAG